MKPREWARSQSHIILISIQRMQREKSVAQKVLFSKHDVFSVLEDKKIRLKAAYLLLPDNEALDDGVIQRLKADYMLNVPTLKTEEMSYVENTTKIDARRLPNRIFFPGTGSVMEDATELIIHIPFVGDPGVFNIAPSAYNSRIAEGEIVGQELLLRIVVVDSSYDLQGHIDREVQQINWALMHLREKDAYFNQELGAVLARAVASRRRAVESRSSIAGRLNISQRQPPPQARTNPATSARAVSVKKSEPQERNERWDVFISHASEDKAYVEPLAKTLEAAGVSVWYDRLILEWGDDLRPMIDNGLLNCRYGVVVLSKAFLGKKKWTEHELNGLFAREQAGKKLVLPIWHGITRDDLLQYSPTLADRLAKMSKTDSYEDIVNSLLGMLGTQTTEQNKLQTAPIPPSTYKTIANANRWRASRSSQDSEDLSLREMELLWAAAKDSNGEIQFSQTFDGEGIRANGRHFLKDADARIAAEWLGAMRGLEDRGFIEPLSSERSFFKVTDKGYKAADQLDEFARWDVQAIVLRGHYVNAPKEEYSLSCKGIIVIPARYFDDQVAADGSVMRSLKECRSLLVEGINPDLLGSWNPNEVEFVDTVSGQLERFQIDGMQFVPPTSLKMPILV